MCCVPGSLFTKKIPSYGYMNPHNRLNMVWRRRFMTKMVIPIRRCIFVTYPSSPVAPTLLYELTFFWSCMASGTYTQHMCMNTWGTLLLSDHLQICRCHKFDYLQLRRDPIASLIMLFQIYRPLLIKIYYAMEFSEELVKKIKWW